MRTVGQASARINEALELRVKDVYKGASHLLTFVTPKSGFMSSYFESLARNQF